MPETPRTWTLKRVNVFAYNVIGGDKDLALGESIDVIEKAPVDVERERLLDLGGDLAEAALAVVRGGSGDDLDHLQKAQRSFRAVLNEYGRLGKEGS